MKNYFLLVLLLISLHAYSFSYKNMFWSLICPIESIESEVEVKLKEWHKKDDEDQYIFADDSFTSDNRRFGDLRKMFPENDPTSVDRLAKVLLLAKHNRLVRQAALVIDLHGGPSETISSDVDYEKTWNNQPERERLWWTFRYRRPYTYGLTLGKYLLEVALIAQLMKPVYQWYSRQTNAHS